MALFGTMGSLQSTLPMTAKSMAAKSGPGGSLFESILAGLAAGAPQQQAPPEHASFNWQSPPGFALMNQLMALQRPQQPPQIQTAFEYPPFPNPAMTAYRGGY